MASSAPDLAREALEEEQGRLCREESLRRLDAIRAKHDVDFAAAVAAEAAARAKPANTS